ncbi:FAD-dependent monooxygenase [Sphingomonas immobilis]|uniref:FAD-dependent monooxygenase n=1 Tax=Sphingomonas immobilis TaxID=3063997 RepID=A0ABT8ZUJ5_9SPHN|nr:FAD-dependent monooxygenase [Sphingomonas sp. CA1-15]MDO7840799.1 FAD-dependent monooxygenase [Sphingomonas sp. CA1-15]
MARLLIAGAGIAGLTTAIAARRSGHEVIVLERAPQLLELGAGLQLAPNGTRVLLHLGLEERIRRVASETDGKVIRLWSTGQTWKLFDLGAQSRELYGAPYWMIHRGDLHRVLLEAAVESGVEIRTSTEVCGVDQSPSGVRVHVAGGEIVEGDAAVGADGIHSIFRAARFVADAPRFTGILAWRGVAEASKLPASLTENVGTNWVGPGKHVISYPLRGGTLVNFVGVVERDDWLVESWTDRGDRSECLADFAGWHPDVRALIEGIDEHFKWALLAREPLQRCADGRILVLGDACHPTLPFLAQGANMAIEDALVAVRCLDRHADPVTAFRAFEEMRLERTGRIVQGSSDQAKIFHNAAYAEAETAAAIIDREWRPDKVQMRYDWLFRYDAVNETIPSIPGARAGERTAGRADARN